MALGGWSSFVNIVAVSISEYVVGDGFVDVGVSIPGRLRFGLKADAERIRRVEDGKLGEKVVCVRLADACL